jgi:hypothetical protein
MAEFGLSMRVIVVDTSGIIHFESTVDGLLPGAFTPKDLI